MNIVLTGFMGTGKTAVGRHLANELHIPFIDVDMTIAKKAGKSIQQIFTSQGEDAFRELETSALMAVAGNDKTVIATGGGALLSEKNREILQRNGILICLTAKMGTLLERLKDDLTRPLLAGENLEHKIARLMKERQDVYKLCALQVDTEGKTIAQVSNEIIEKVRPQWQN
jgi:shikimate kinase